MNDFTLQNWQTANGTQLVAHSEGLLYSDGLQGPHVIWHRDDAFRHQLLSLTIRFRPLETCDTRLHVRVWDGPSVCSIAMDGDIELGAALHVSCSAASGWINVNVVYWNTNDLVTIGSAKETYLYFSGQKPQFLFADIDIAIMPVPPVSPLDPAVFVDVGALGGLSAGVKAMGEQIKAVMFEPNAAEAAHLQANSPDGTIIFAEALADRVGPRAINITRHPGCSSLLEPNKTLLAAYPGVSSWFDVVGTAEVSCTTYESLYSAGRAPAPDIIKIDTQGLEYEVLTGFGDLLYECIAIELESHIRPLYLDQKVISDIVALLSKFGLNLVKMQSQGWFEGDQLEFNAWFLKDAAWIRDNKPEMAGKYFLARRMWSI